MSMRQNHVGGDYREMRVTQDMQLVSMTMAVTADWPIPASSPPVLLLDPNGGAKDVLLPAEATSQDRVLWIYNTADAAENLVVKEDSDTTIIATLAQGASGLFHCDGTTWRQIS